LKDKRLLDVCKALKIKGFTVAVKPPKATVKTTVKKQTVENQALDEIF
jgi:hypothetical protein